MAPINAVATAASFAPLTGPYETPFIVTVYASSASVPATLKATTGALFITLSDNPAGNPLTLAVVAPPYK